MSVFSDFQTLWQQKFPDSDLSSATRPWIEDVKLSLTRHKEKIAELTKELEQEQLYVEYLERLLDEVEKYRENGTDPAQLFDSASPPTASNRVSMNEKNGVTTDNKEESPPHEYQQQQEVKVLSLCAFTIKMQI